LQSRRRWPEAYAAGVAQHVRMRLELKAGAGGGTLDHPGKAGGRERGSALADEDVPSFRFATPAGAGSGAGSQKIRELSNADRYNAVRHRRPQKAPALEPLREQACTLAVVPDYFY
jgi:hypothetical protein